MKTVSAILINSGRDDDLVANSRMLAEHATRATVGLHIVAHNTSRAAETAIRESWPSVDWHAAEEFGVASMRNAGARASTSDTLLFLDTDTVLHERALDRLLDGLDRDSRRAAVGPKILNPDGTLQMSARRFYTPASLILRRVGRSVLGNSARGIRRNRSFLGDDRVRIRGRRLVLPGLESRVESVVRPKCRRYASVRAVKRWPQPPDGKPPRGRRSILRT